MPSAPASPVRALDCAEVLQVSLVYRPGRLSPAAAAFLGVTEEVVGAPR